MYILRRAISLMALVCLVLLDSSAHATSFLILLDGRAASRREFWYRNCIVMIGKVFVIIT